MKMKLGTFLRLCSEKTGVRFAAVLAKAVVLCSSIYITIGALVYPDWWRLFFWGGGWFDARVWRLGWVTLRLAFGAFWPFGFLVLVFVIAVGFWCFYQYGRQGQRFWSGGLGSRILPKRIWLGSVALCALVCLSLLPRTPMKYDSFWLAMENERFTKDLLSRMKAQSLGLPRSEFAPPEDGIYLYLNEDLIVRQFRALMPPFGVTAEKEKTSLNRDVKLQAGGGKVGAISAGTSSSKETEVTKESSPVSAPFAAQQLISRLSGSDDTVKIGPTTGLLSDAVTGLTNKLKKLGVELTSEQLRTLENNDRENYKKEILKVDRMKVLMYSGSVYISRGPKGVLLKFEAEGPVKLVGTGLLKQEGLGDHLGLALQGDNPSVNLISVSMYGVVETRSESSNTVQVVITPYAAW